MSAQQPARTMPRSLDVFRLDGRTAVVVGAASGLGQITAVSLADAGAHVVCADISDTGAQASAEIIRERGGSAEWDVCDVTSAASAEAFAERRAAAEILVITPGMNVRKPLISTDDDDFDRVMEINLKGTYRLMRDFGRAMSERGRGSIIAFASMRALDIEPGQGLYAAMKAGVVQLTKTLASELGQTGVRVNAILPGPFDSPLTAQIKNDPEWYEAYTTKNALSRWGELPEMAGPALFLASDASSYVTGQSLQVDGGWTIQDGRFTPRI